MRLDHLLSKEHLAATSPVMGGGGCPGPLSLPNEWGTVLEGGTSTMAGSSSWWRLVRRPSGRVGTVAAGVGGRSGTLLGPEGTAGRLFVQGRYESVPRLWVGGRVGWLRAGTAQTNRSGRCFGVGWVGAGVRVLVAGRSLRTAQWTRASF